MKEGVEYNLALGDRRANSVKDALTAIGVDSSRIETISYGSEKPIAFGKDEKSYSLNRRVDIVYLNNLNNWLPILYSRRNQLKHLFFSFIFLFFFILILCPSS